MVALRRSKAKHLRQERIAICGSKLAPTVFGSVKGPGNVFQMIRAKGFGGVVAHAFEHSCD
jgi:hypothetical protein